MENQAETHLWEAKRAVQPLAGGKKETTAQVPQCPGLTSPAGPVTHFVLQKSVAKMSEERSHDGQERKTLYI